MFYGAVPVRHRLAAAVALALALCSAFGWGRAVAATPGEITTFEVPDLCYPYSIWPAPREGVSLRLCELSESEVGHSLELGTTLANLLPGGQVERRTVPTSAPGPILPGPGGELWFGANSALWQGEPAAVERLAPDGSVRRFPISRAVKGRTSRTVLGLAPADDGGLWAAVGEGAPNFTALGGSLGGQLTRIAPDGTESHFTLPHRIEPLSIVLGPDGNAWFTAVRGRWREEHYFDPGIGYVGRITPTGRLSLFRIPGKRTDPVAIAVAPDGALWFAEAEASLIGTIGVDGKLGRRYLLRQGYPEGLVFGPEGDAWMPSSYRGILRMTPSGQQTRFPFKAKQVTAGHEGNIWAVAEGGQVARIVPGAPGIDVTAIRFDSRSRTARVRLACGGSTSACEGTLNLALPIYRREAGKKIVGNTRRTYTFARIPYSVAAESTGGVTTSLPTRALALAALPQPRFSGLVVRVQATVAGGPELVRAVPASTVAQEAYSASSTK